MSNSQPGPNAALHLHMDSELQMKEYGDESKSGGDASPILDPSIDSSDDVGDDEPPDGGYGWVCVIVCFMINAHTWGINSAYGVFLAYYLSSNTFPGATRTQFAFIGGLSVSSALLLSPLATFSARRLGTRATLLLGVLFQTTSFVAASYSRRVWQLFLSQGLCFGLGLGFLFVVSVGIVPQWFKARRSLANGVAAAGSGFGGLAYSLAAGAMIPRLGLPWAFRVLAVVSFVVNFVCAILLRDRNAQVGSSLAAFDVRLFRGAEFWGLLGFGFFSMLGYVVLLFSIPNYASRVGLTAHQGSVVGAVLNLGQGLGRGPIGYFSDAVGRINIAAMLSLLSSVLALVLWTEARTYGVLIFYALIGGTVAGTYWATVAPVTAEVVGLKELPSALSITWVFLAIPTLVSEPIGLGIVSKRHGDYLGAQMFCGFMYLAAALCLGALRAWKIGQLERDSQDAGDGGKRSGIVSRLFKLRKV